MSVQGRYTVALLGYPNTEDDIRQRYALAGIQGRAEIQAGGVTSTLGGFTSGLQGTHTAPAVSWTEDDRYSIALIPAPGSTSNTRLTLAGVYGTEDLAGDRNGAIGATLGTFVADFDGTFVDPTPRDGDIVSVIGSFTSGLQGTHIWSHFFEGEFSIKPTWVARFQPARTGDLDSTISGFSSALAGTTLPVDSTDGNVESVVGGFSASFAGTLTAPPSFAGNIETTLEVFASNVRGVAIPPDSVQGSLAGTIESFSAAFSGTTAVPGFTGDIDSVLGSFGSLVQGQFIDADAIYGLVNSRIGAFRASARGTYSVQIFTEAPQRDTVTVDVENTELVVLRENTKIVA